MVQINYSYLWERPTYHRFSVALTMLHSFWSKSCRNTFTQFCISDIHIPIYTQPDKNELFISKRAFTSWYWLFFVFTSDSSSPHCKYFSSVIWSRVGGEYRWVVVHTWFHAISNGTFCASCHESQGLSLLTGEGGEVRKTDKPYPDSCMKKLFLVWKVPGSGTACFSMTWPFLFSFLNVTGNVGTKSRWMVRNTLTAKQLANEMQITFIWMAKDSYLPSEF